MENERNLGQTLLHIPWLKSFKWNHCHPTFWYSISWNCLVTLLEEEASANCKRPPLLYQTHKKRFSPLQSYLHTADFCPQLPCTHNPIDSVEAPGMCWEQNLARWATRLGILLLPLTTSELDPWAYELLEKSSGFLFPLYLITLTWKYTKWKLELLASMGFLHQINCGRDLEKLRLSKFLNSIPWQNSFM